MGSRLTIFQKILILLALPVGLQGGVIVALLTMQQRAGEEQEWVDHTQRVLASAHQLGGAASEVLSATRGQVVAPEERLVQAYQSGIKSLNDQLAQLKSLVADNPDQRARVNLIERKVGEFVAWTESTLREIRLGDVAAAIDRIKRLDGQRRIDELRAPLDQFMLEEERLDATRRIALLDSETLINNVIVVSFLLMISASALMAWTLRRGIVQRLAHLQENANRVALRHPLLAPLDGDDEFTELDVQFRRMASRLETLADRDRRYAVGLETTIAHQAEQEERLKVSFEELRKEAEVVRETSRLKSEFLANMSHELRTPLNSIIGFAELMHDERVGPVSEDHKEFLGDILTSSRHLLQLINDVLDLAKVEAGKMEFFAEQFELGPIVKEVCELLRTQAAVKRITVQRVISGAIGPVRLDVGKFKQVLFNFLSNAIKFTPADGKITVRVTPEGKDEFKIAVEDTGVGISDEDVSRLFVEFTQLDSSRTKKHQGTGLGLSLTRRIVEAQEGRVGVTSKLGEGSTFFAVLPKEFSSFDEHGQPLSAEVGGGRKRRESVGKVLVVEDDARDLEWLTNVLKEAGYTVAPARSGREAIPLVQDSRFDS
ncbi:MAG TPA: ATP-binding protein, partial [Pirellulales bacterium]